MHISPYLIDIFYFIIGLVFGSFATMASYRLLKGESFHKRSKCPKCKHTLGIKDLFPVFSYLVQNGKCRHCHTKISIRYPLTELLTGFAFFIIGARFGDLPIYAVLLCALTLALIIMIVTDFEAYIIPDEIIVSLILLGILYCYYKSFTLSQVVFMPVILFVFAMALKYGFKVLMKKDGLGFGDVKFFAVSGLYLTPDAVSSFFFLSGVTGIVTAVVWKYLKRGPVFPFGPALAMALYIVLVFPQLVDHVNSIFK